MSSAASSSSGRAERPATVSSSSGSAEQPAPSLLSAAQPASLPSRAVPFPPNFGAGTPATVYHDDGSEFLFSIASLNRSVAPGPAPGEGTPYLCSCYYALDLLSPQPRSGPCHRSECEFCDVPMSNARSRGVGAPSGTGTAAESSDSALGAEPILAATPQIIDIRCTKRCRYQVPISGEGSAQCENQCEKTRCHPGLHRCGLLLRTDHRDEYSSSYDHRSGCLGVSPTFPDLSYCGLDHLEPTLYAEMLTYLRLSPHERDNGISRCNRLANIKWREKWMVGMSEMLDIATVRVERHQSLCSTWLADLRDIVGDGGANMVWPLDT